MHILPDDSLGWLLFLNSVAFMILNENFLGSWDSNSVPQRLKPAFSNHARVVFANSNKNSHHKGLLLCKQNLNSHPPFGLCEPESFVMECYLG